MVHKYCLELGEDLLSKLAVITVLGGGFFLHIFTLHFFIWWIISSSFIFYSLSRVVMLSVNSRHACVCDVVLQ